MTRLLPLLVLLAFSGCEGTPKFKVGDCFIPKIKHYKDPWLNEPPDKIFKVLEVGQESYRLNLHWISDSANQEAFRPIGGEKPYEKISCPKEKP